METRDIVDLLKKKTREDPEKYNLFICGPDYTDTRLRVYAHGGLLCKLPTDAESNIKLPAPAYLNRYLPEKPFLYKALQKLSGDDEKRSFLLDNLDDLLLCLKRRFTTTKREETERGKQTAIARGNTSFKRPGGTVVCDFGFGLPKSMGQGDFDLVTFSMDGPDHGVFMFVEYKCSAKTCGGTNGLAKHAKDMLYCMSDPDVSAWSKEQLISRLRLMRDYGLLQDCPEELDRLGPEKVALRAGFLFTPGEGLRGPERAAALCEKHILPADIRDKFSYRYADSLEEVDLSQKEMGSWEAFGGTEAVWEYLKPPAGGDDANLGEALVEQLVTAKMREYDGAVFFCCAPRDQERIETFTRAARAAGKEAIFVHHKQREALGDTLAACPAGERHAVFYSRRRGNGPSPHMSAFLDFWLERNVDIWDLRDIDNALKAGKQP